MTPAPRPAYLFVLPWSPEHPGGVNQVVINLAREMRRRGAYEPLVLVADWTAPEPVWGDFHGLRTVRWRIRSCTSRSGWKERLACAWWLLRFGPAFRRFCREQRVAAINPHYPGPSAFTLERAAGPGMPLILSFHGADIAGLRAGPAADAARWRALLRRVRASVVCSRDLGRELNAAWGSDLAPVVIHNGLDAPAFVAGAAQDPSPAGRRSLLNVAKFERKKGQDVLVRAFAALAGDYPDLDLVLVGATDEALPELRALCDRLGVAARVRFHEDVPHARVAGFFRGASLFALPSRIEPFGIVLLEAGAMGVPVVASAVGGVPEILEHGVTGRLVPPDDAAALALELRAVLDAPAEARAMAERLRQRVLAGFTWSAACAGYAALLRPGRAIPPDAGADR